MQRINIFISHFEVVEVILHTSSFHILKTILYIAICICVNQTMTMMNDLKNVKKADRKIAREPISQIRSFIRE